MHTSTWIHRPNVWQIWASVFVCFMVISNVVWIRVNHAPPRMYDDALYHADSIQLVQALESGNRAWFWQLFTTPARGIHPPMVKTLPVPFHILFGPSPRSGLYSFTALIPVFGIYVFLIAKRLFDSDRVAFCALAVTCLFPLTYGLWRNLMAEFGTAVAAVGAVYHLHRSDGFRSTLHSILFGVFLAWGLWWKVSFPAFVMPLLIYIIIVGIRTSRYSTLISNLSLTVMTAALLLAPFYLTRGKAVLSFAAFASEGNSITGLWSLGPPLWPATIARYWLAMINSGTSAFLFVVFAVLLVVNVMWLARIGTNQSWLVLALWFVPAWLFFSIQLMKEERHLFPVYPAVGIATAALAKPILDRSRAARGAMIACFLLWPSYQYLASSFDHAALPRPDIRVGPFTLLVSDLQLASLQLIPSYTFPAFPVRWPTGEVVDLIASNASGVNPPLRLKVVGDSPFFSGVVIYLESVLKRVHLTSHGAFYKGLGINWDFVLDLCGPEHKYGPLDEREPVISALLRNGKLPYRPIGSVHLPVGCDATVYRKSLTDSFLMTDVLRGYADIGHPLTGMGNDGTLDMSQERVVPLVYVPPSGATLVFEDNAGLQDRNYDVYATELDAAQQDLRVEALPNRTSIGWVKRAVRLDGFRGKMIGLRFVPRQEGGRPRLVHLRNLRLQLPGSVS